MILIILQGILSLEHAEFNTHCFRIALITDSILTYSTNLQYCVKFKSFVTI